MNQSINNGFYASLGPTSIIEYNANAVDCVLQSSEVHSARSSYDRPSMVLRKGVLCRPTHRPIEWREGVRTRTIRGTGSAAL